MDSLGWLDPISFWGDSTYFQGPTVSCREGNTHNALQAHTSLNELVMLNKVCLWSSICHRWHMEISQKNQWMEPPKIHGNRVVQQSVGRWLEKQRLAYQHLQGNVLRNGKQKGGTKFPQGFTNEKKTLFVSKLQFKQVSKPEIINHLPHLKARPRHIIDLVHCDRLDATHPDMLRSRRW